MYVVDASSWLAYPQLLQNTVGTEFYQLMDLKGSNTEREISVCLGVQINKMSCCVVGFSWHLYWSHVEWADVCTMHAVIRDEHECAAALLWHRHVPSCGLVIGPGHPSYKKKKKKKNSKKVYNLLYTLPITLGCQFTCCQKCDVWSKLSRFKA